MSDASQTEYSFRKKWENFSSYQFGGRDSFDRNTLDWIVERNGFGSVEEFAHHVDQYSTVLDAGCGNGRILSLFLDVLGKGHVFFGVDVAAADIARKNLAGSNVTVLEGDLTNAASLKSIPQPDFIYCQEVLHHTSDPAGSFANLAELLASGGEIAIYVYKLKAPIREFTDDFVRSLITGLSHDEAMEITNEFAEFGRVLSELNVPVDVPKLSLLGIEAGTYTVQRLLYNFFVKCYWNPELSAAENNMINFDWYHPSLCSRHTLEEVHGWFSTNRIEVIHSCVDDYGITVRGKKG
jgi:SAM-dependent methyltransferase